MTPSRILLGTAVLLASFMPCLHGDEKDGMRELDMMGNVSTLAMLANVDSFEFYRCRFRCSHAEAQSIEDAVRGKFSTIRFYDCRLSRDGEKVGFQGLSPPTPPDMSRAVPVAGKKGVYQLPAFGNSDRYTGDERRELNYVPEMRLASLGRQESAYGGIRDRTPFLQLGLDRAPGGLLRKAIAGAAHYHPPRCTGLEELSGAPAVVLEIASKEPGSTNRYWLDPARGHLPVKQVATVNGKLRSETHLTHIRECSDQRWFPERSVTVYAPARSGAPYGVLELKVLELDADHRPDPAEFVLRLPGGTQINDHGDVLKFFHLKQEESIGLDELPAIAKMLDRARANPLMDTAIPRPSPYRWAYRGVLLTTGVALLFGGAWLFFRRRFRRHTG